MNISVCGASAKRLGAILMLSSSLTIVALAQPAQAGDIDRFASSGYTYCDAKLLGALFNKSVDDAKLLIGEKIRNGIGSNIPLVLRESRQDGNSCSWEDTGYSYEDAEQLAQLWGLAQPYDAKLKVARYVTRGQSRIVDRALGNSGQ